MRIYKSLIKKLFKLIATCTWHYTYYNIHTEFPLVASFWGRRNLNLKNPSIHPDPISGIYVSRDSCKSAFIFTWATQQA
jgi:hypothetical protein